MKALATAVAALGLTLGMPGISSGIDFGDVCTQPVSKSGASRTVINTCSHPVAMDIFGTKGTHKHKVVRGKTKWTFQLKPGEMVNINISGECSPKLVKNGRCPSFK